MGGGISGKRKSTLLKAEKAENGQTRLDISKGDIIITSKGATLNGAVDDALNEKGYWITGTTTKYHLVVEPEVTTAITLDNVDITVDTTKLDCINVSHADVVITLVGKNRLYSQAGGRDDIYKNGNAITKDGMDGSLTIQCENADKKGHRCNESCGSLSAKGDPSKFHAGAIGGTYRVAINPDTKPIETGFVNFTIKGGNIEASAGAHCPGIGAACRAQEKGGYTKDILISGGNVTAVGTQYGSGIGSGMGTKVDGIRITGGTVKATGGQYAPGIGASGTADSFVSFQTQETENVVISGGDTVVTAIGDDGGMPGIGSGGGNSKVKNVKASPDTGYQGYIQDGTSLTDYTFMNGTPFSGPTDIKVGRFYTKVYFGPFRDANDIDKTSKEQIGANHLISKSGGEPFTEEQLKQLTKVTGKQENGEYFPEDQLSIADTKQLEAINEAKKKGKIGDFPLTYTTVNGTKATVTVSLRTDGTDAAKINPENPTSMIGANDFREETGGEPFTDEEIKQLGDLKGKDPLGNNILLEDYLLDGEQYKKINDAKTAGKAGVFPLTYETADGKKAMINVTLIKYDQTAQNSENGETLKGKDVISKTGGAAFGEEQLLEMTKAAALDQDGNPLPKGQINFADSSQVQKINKAKTSGSTGEFPLTVKTDNGTEVTVTVFLTDEGSDGAAYDPGNPVPSIGANDGEHETGGEPFTEEEIIKLCKARGKNGNGDTLDLAVDKSRLSALNTAKKAAKTGVFPVIFSMDDGTKVQVNVTLTGKHNITFDPNGGDYTPEVQTPEGGGCLVRPKEPKKDGYEFAGWFYTDEDGTEKEWNFRDPVHQDMTLTAKWNKISAEKGQKEEETSDGNSDSGQGSKSKTKEKNVPDWEYNKREGENSQTSTAKTSDRNPVHIMLGLSAAGLCGIAILFKKKTKY